MEEIKKDSKSKPGVRKGQIRSFTAKNNTITKKNPNKKQQLKIPILAIKSKKKMKMKKKVPLNKKSIEQKKKVAFKKIKKSKKKVKMPSTDLVSEDEVEYEQVSGVNERKRRQ